MNILITGGLGYLGLEICLAIDKQAETCIYTMGRSPNSTISLPPNCQHIQSTILDYESCVDILNRYEISHLVHAAGVRTRTCEDDPLAGVTGNIIGTENVFRAAANSTSIKHTILISTAAVYGKRTEIVNEECPLSPGSHYALTKAASELAAIGHAEKAGFPLQIVRPGYVVGIGKSGKKPMGSFNQLILDAWAGIPHTACFSPKFFVHCAADIGAYTANMLSDEAQGCEVFHLPGINCAATDLVERLRRVVTDSEFSDPDITLQQDDALPIPYGLDFLKYEQRFGTSEPTPLEAVFKEFTI